MDFLHKEIENLRSQTPLDSKEYYRISLFFDEENKPEFFVDSNWVGYTKENPKREIREAALINPQKAIDLFYSIGEPVLIINNLKDFFFFIGVIGGHTIIEKSIAYKHLPHLIVPSITCYEMEKGYSFIESIPKEKLNHAPTYQLRSKVLIRDNRKCKICGESPANNVHIVLNLHHILPYSKGGLTEEKNLITLCHTCHRGLDPHYDISLFDIIGCKIFPEIVTNKQYNDKLIQNIKSLHLIRKNTFKAK